MWDLIIKNARVVDPVNHLDAKADVAVQDGRIAAVGDMFEGEAREVKDCTGLVLMPGLIDSHLHLGSMFGSPYGHRMAALAGVTTCLDMAGPIEDILSCAKDAGVGLNVAMLEGFSPNDLFGTMNPTEEQMRGFIRDTLERGALGFKLMGGHWPLPVETCKEMVALADEMNSYCAWHAGSMTAGSNIEGFREVLDAVKTHRLHLAHINAYCRGRIAPVLDEALEAIEGLKQHPNIWSESYVAVNNGTILTCDKEGKMIDHVTQTCLKTFGFEPNAKGMRQAFLAHCAYAVRDNGTISELIEGEEALRYWEEKNTDIGGSFPVNPALSRYLLAQAKRDDGSFVVDAISTDGGCIPRNLQIETGLSLVRFGALSLSEFVVKTSVNPARHLRLQDRGHLSIGATADITVFDLERQKAIATWVNGKPILENGQVLGKSMQVICTEAGRQTLNERGFETIVVSLDTPEPARYIP